MAIIAREIVSFDNGLCVWEYDYDSTNLRLTQVRCTNNGPFPTRGTVTVLANGRTLTRLVAAGGSLDQAIPTGAAVRLSITVDARGRINGIDHTFSYGSGVV